MARRTRRGVGIILGALILLVIMLIALMIVIRLVTQTTEMRAGGGGGSGARSAYAASLLASTLCVCTSQDALVKNVQFSTKTSCTLSLLTISYKKNAPLPNALLYSVTADLNVEGQRLTIAAYPSKEDSLVLNVNGKTVTLYWTLWLPESGVNIISKLAEYSEKQGILMAPANANVTGFPVVAIVPFQICGDVQINVTDVKIATNVGLIDVVPCEYTVPSAQSTVMTLQGMLSSQYCNCTCRIKGLPATQWISLAAVMTNEKCPAPPDDRTAVFFIPFKVRSEADRSDFPIVIPVNATKLAMMDGAGGEGFPERYLKLAYNGDPHLEERLNFFENTCGPGGWKCAYIYGIVAWVKNQEGDKVPVKWSFTPSVATLSNVTYNGNTITKLTFYSKTLGNKIVLEDKNGDGIPEVYVCNQNCTMIAPSPRFLSDHWGFFTPPVNLLWNYIIYQGNGIPPAPTTPTQTFGVPIKSGSFKLQVGKTFAFEGESYGGELGGVKADYVIKYPDPAATGSTAYGVASTTFNALINGTIYLTVNAYDVGFAVFLDNKPVFTSWSERRTVTENVKEYYIDIINKANFDIPDAQVKVDLPPELVGKPLTILTQDGKPVPFCYELSKLSGQINSYGPCVTEPSYNAYRIWLRVDLPANAEVKLKVLVGVNGATDPRNVFLYYDNFDTDLGWKPFTGSFNGVPFCGTVKVPDDQVPPFYSNGAALKVAQAYADNVLAAGTTAGCTACDPAGGYLQLPSPAPPSRLNIIVNYSGETDVTDYSLRIVTPYKGQPLEVLVNGTQVPFCYETLTGECTSNYTQSTGVIWIKTDLIVDKYLNVTIIPGKANLASPPEDVFLFYDNFTGTDLNPAKWVTNNADGYYRLQDGELQMWGDWNVWWTSSPVGYNRVIETYNVFTVKPVVIEGRAKTDPYIAGDADLGVLITPNGPTNVYTNYVGLAVVTRSGNPAGVYQATALGVPLYKFGDTSMSPTTWRFFKIIYTGTDVKLIRSTTVEGMIDNVGDVDSTTLPTSLNYATYYIAIHGDTDASITSGLAHLDWIRVRKYIDPALISIKYVNWNPGYVEVNDNVGLAIEFFNYRLKTFMQCPVSRVGLEDDYGNGFTTVIDFYNQLLGFDVREGGIAVQCPSGCASTIPGFPMTLNTGVWYFVSLRILPDKVGIFIDGSSTGQVWVPSSDLKLSPIRKYTRIVVRGGWPYWIDELRIRKYVDPFVYANFTYVIKPVTKLLSSQLKTEIPIRVTVGSHRLTIVWFDANVTGYLIASLTDKGAGVFYKPLLSDYGYGNAAGWVTLEVPFTVHKGDEVEGGVCLYVKYWPLEIWDQLGGPYLGTNFMPPVVVKPASSYIPPPQGEYGVFYAPLERGCYLSNVQGKLEINGTTKVSCPMYMQNLHGTQPSLLINVPFEETFDEYGLDALTSGTLNAKTMVESGKWNILANSKVYVGDFDTWLKEQGYPIANNDKGDMELMIQGGGVYLSDNVMDRIRGEMMGRWVACFDVLLATSGTYNGYNTTGGPGEGMTFSFYKSFNYIPGLGPLLGFYGTGDSSGFGLEIDTRYTHLAQFDGTNDYYLDNEPPAPHYALIYRTSITPWLPGEVLSRSVTTYNDLLNRWHRICVEVQPEEARLVANSYYTQVMRFKAVEVNNTGNIVRTIINSNVTSMNYGGGSGVGSDVFEYSSGKAVKWYVATFYCNDTTCVSTEPLSPTDLTSTATPISYTLDNVVANNTPIVITSRFPLTFSVEPTANVYLFTPPNQGITVFNGPDKNYIYGSTEFWAQVWRWRYNVVYAPGPQNLGENIIWTGIDFNGNADSERSVIVAEFNATTTGLVILQIQGGDAIKVWYQYKPVGGEWQAPKVLLDLWGIARNNPSYVVPIFVKSGSYRIIVVWADYSAPEYVTVKIYNAKGIVAWTTRLFYDANIQNCPADVVPALPPDPARYIIPEVKVGEDITALLRPPTFTITNYFYNTATNTYSDWSPSNVIEIANSPSLAIWPNTVNALGFNVFYPSASPTYSGSYIIIIGQLFQSLYSYPAGVIEPLGSSWFWGSEDAVLPEGIPMPYTLVRVDPNTHLYQIVKPYFGPIPTDASTYLLYDGPADSNYYLLWQFDSTDVYVAGTYPLNPIDVAINILSPTRVSVIDFDPGPTFNGVSPANDKAVFGVAYSIVQITKPTILKFDLTSTNGHEVVVAKITYDEERGRWIIAEPPKVVESAWSYSNQIKRSFTVHFDEPGYYLVVIYFANSCNGGGLYVRVSEMTTPSSMGIYIPSAWSVGFTASGNLDAKNVTTLIDNFRICTAPSTVSDANLIRMCGSDQYYKYAKEGKIKVLVDDDFNYLNGMAVVKRYEPGPDETNTPTLGVGVEREGGNTVLRLVPNEPDKATVLLLTKNVDTLRWMLTNNPWLMRLRFKVIGAPEGFAVAFYKEYYPMGENITSVWQVRPWGGSALGLIAGPGAGYSPGYAVEVDLFRSVVPLSETNYARMLGLFLESELPSGAHVALDKDSPYAKLGYHIIPANLINDSNWHTLIIYVDPLWSGKCYIDASPSLTQNVTETYCAKPAGITAPNACTEPLTCRGRVYVWIDNYLVLNTTAGPNGFSIPENWYIALTATTSDKHVGAVYIDNVTIVVPKSSEANNPQRLVKLLDSNWIKENKYYVVYLTKRDFYETEPWKRPGALEPRNLVFGVLSNGTTWPNGIYQNESLMLSIKHSENEPSLDLEGLPFFDKILTGTIELSVNGSLLITNKLTNITRPSWEGFINVSGIYAGWSPLTCHGNFTGYEGWQGVHIAKWIQYGYSHGERWSSFWWDVVYRPASLFAPWGRARFGVTFYESGDVLFQYDRFDLPLNVTAGLKDLIIGLSNGYGWLAVISTVKGGQQVGIFSDVWNAMDFFSLAKEPETPDNELVLVNSTMGVVSVAERDGYVNYAFSPMGDILVQYQGNLYTIIGSPECINCRAPLIQPPPSPQPAEVAQVPPDCWCVCNVGAQNYQASAQGTLGVVTIRCSMRLK